jgi:polyhydroxybutyrate depolymerase
MNKQIWLAVGLCCVLILAACTESKVGLNPMTRHVLAHDGLEREFFVFLPSSYDGEKEYPVAIFMHGYGGTATGTEAEVAQGLNAYAEKYGYMMVYPQGTWFMSGDTPETRWEVTSWNHISDGFDTGPEGPICLADRPDTPCPPECGSCGNCGWTSCSDDIGFLKSLVSAISAEFSIASNSLFVSGFSNGAMMTHRIACEASELFAGAVLVGGRVERGFECTPTKRLPLLQMNGGQDATVPHDGSISSDKYYYASTTSVAEQWNDGEACAVLRDDWLSPAIAGEDVQCTIACAATDHPSLDCIWPQGNHRWPGTPGFRGSNGYCVTELQSDSMPEQLICIAPDHSIDKWGSRLMFEFFNEHRGT